MRLSEIVEYWDGILFSMYNATAHLKYLCLPRKNKKIYKKCAELKDKHKGQRCFVIMNGPSVNQHDLSALKNEVVFCANTMYIAPLAATVDPNYYCWCDSKVFQTDECKDVVAGIRTACPNAKMVFSYRGLDRLGVQDDIYYAYCKHLSSVYKVRSRLDKLCSNFHTVAFFTINAALYMGFSEIYVLGLDFEPGGFVHFDKNMGTALRPSEHTEKKNVAGIHWEYMKDHYESYALNEHAKKLGAKIINLNPNSCIRAFEFGDYEELMNEAKHEN